MDPCPSCRRLVRRDGRGCPFCERRRAVGVLGAALVLVACEPTMQPVVVEAPANDPAIDAGPNSTPPPPTASALPTTEHRSRRRVITIEPVYGGPPPPVEEEIV